MWEPVLKVSKGDWVWWYMPVIPATQEAEVAGKIRARPYLKHYKHFCKCHNIFLVQQ
jgi:hypothetical protein